MTARFLPDDVVKTRDGKEFRVIWECKSTTHLYVRSLSKDRKKLMLKIASVVHHTRKGVVQC